jgi:hypothetical protein
LLPWLAVPVQSNCSADCLRCPAVVSAWHGRCFTLPGGRWPRLFPGRSVGFLGLPGQSCRANESVLRPVELFGQLLGERRSLSILACLRFVKLFGRSAAGASLRSWLLSCNMMRPYLLLTQDAASGRGQAAIRALERSVGFLGLLRERPVSFSVGFPGTRSTFSDWRRLIALRPGRSFACILSGMPWRSCQFWTAWPAVSYIVRTAVTCGLASHLFRWPPAISLGVG